MKPKPWMIVTALVVAALLFVIFNFSVLSWG